jgi:hypothetical protein
MRKIRITSGNVSVTAQLSESATARAIWGRLPLEAQANVWGEEIYFEVPVQLPQEPEARQEVEVGALAYWPVGNAVCIFFGPTPVSEGSTPRAYSPVNVFGKVDGDAKVFRAVADGAAVKVEEIG